MRPGLAVLAVVAFGAVTGALTQASAPSRPAGHGGSAPNRLRCEYLVDPLGIGRAAPRLSWALADTRRGAVQRAYQILVADNLEALNADAGNLWDSGRVASDESVNVVYAGKPLRSRMRAYWKVRVWDKDDQPSRWSDPSCWSMGLLDPADWAGKWIGDSAVPTRTSRAPDEATSRPAPGPEPLPPPLLRKGFKLPDESATVKAATVYVTALGLYELRINGQRVGDHVLAPEWTDYRQRVQYQTYDVTALLRPGENAIGALLGDGWYAGRIGLTQIVPNGPVRGIYGRRPQLLLRLDVELADGRTITVLSDESWRMTTDGPVRVGDLLDGEEYDAARELPGWDRPGFDDAAWKSADVFPASSAKLVAQPNEPIRVIQELTPVTLTEPKPGVYVFDLGQNFAGWCRLKIQGSAGTTVTLRHAEVLNPDGTIYTTNLRSAAQTDRYTLSGRGEETFEPHFTYHGFRYVEVTGLPAKPALDALVGCVVCSSAPVAGHFECSSPLLNKLMENIVWTQRANLMSVPTDCPQRDERLGWMGDILAFAQTACFNLDMAAFFTKWVPDVRDAQTEDGRYPDFAPHPFDPAARFSSVAGWGDAGVVVPWRAYVNYADKRLLEEHFDSARRWVDYIRAKNPDLLWKNSRGNDYGDWLNADTLKLEGWPKSGAEVPKEVFATMCFAHSTELVAKMAAAVGRSEEAGRYGTLANEIKAAFNRVYVTADGRMQGDTQAGYALALQFDMLPESVQGAARRRMVDAFETYHGSISTGFHSTVCLMRELSRADFNEQAYRLVNNRTMPSWGYAIDHGATTIWERWDGYVEGRGYQDPGMNSFSHYALGSVGEWMYRTIVGINPDESSPGYKHIVVRPQPGGDVTWATGEYDSLHGKIACRWNAGPDGFVLEITVPANTTATVYVPTRIGATVAEGDQPAEQATGVTFVRMDPGAAVYDVGAGSYRFTVRQTGRGR